jgi:hypothetical protein
VANFLNFLPMAPSVQPGDKAMAPIASPEFFCLSPYFDLNQSRQQHGT